MEPLLTIDELSRLLKIKKSTIYHWTSAGFVPHIKVGRFVRFRVSEIEQWLRERKRVGRKTMAVGFRDQVSIRKAGRNQGEGANRLG
jgi:excisionase family DNA binding protein